MLNYFFLFLLMSCASPAQRLVEEYLARDARGEFLQTNAWWNQNVVCPDCMGGPDFYSVIDRYEIERKNSHEFLVTYFILGTQSADGFKSDVKTLKTVFKVNATQTGLKIEQGAYQMVKQK